MKHWFLDLILDTVFFVLVSLICAYIIDYFIREPDENESFGTSLGLLLLQIVIGVLVIYQLGVIYDNIGMRDPRKYYGLDIFIVLFFMAQPQILSRIDNVYKGFKGLLDISSSSLLKA